LDAKGGLGIDPDMLSFFLIFIYFFENIFLSAEEFFIS